MNLSRSGFLLSLLCLGPPALAAQVAEGNAAWREGRFHEARIAYEQALRDDSTSVRANYRLAVLASWDSRLDSALVLLHRARVTEPDEPDVRLAEAQFLSWRGSFKVALLKYDSLLVDHPDRHDAQLGRAQTLAWAGRLNQAEAAYARMIAADAADYEARAGQAQVSAWRGDLATASERYQAILSSDSGNVQALTGLAQLHHWQGKERLARTEIDRALAADSNNHEARQVRAAVRAGLRPQVEVTLGWSNDSDDNTIWWQTLGTSLSLAEGLRGFASAGAFEASDPARHGTRVSAEAGGAIARGKMEFTAALGLRGLSPSDSASRSVGSWRASASYRLAAATGIGLGYSHYPFDETALLIARHLDVDAVELNLESGLREGLDASLGAGSAWLSDANTRRFMVAAVTQRVTSRATVGVLGRLQGYDFKGAGYFSPDRFTTFEARAAYTQPLLPFEGRLSGGLGTQQVGKGASGQLEWHIEGKVSRRWATANEVSLSGGITNSAVSSTTGAFRYRTAAVTVRLGL